MYVNLKLILLLMLATCKTLRVLRIDCGHDLTIKKSTWPESFFMSLLNNYGLNVPKL